MPIDSMQAYNLLSRVSPVSGDYPLANTFLDILCFERHVRLEKGPDYPERAFAVSADPGLDVEQSLDEQEEQEELLERAMYFHRSRSGADNPHKDTAIKLAAALIDPGLSLQGIPAFTEFSELSSLNRFFDAVDTVQQRRKVLQKSSEDMAKQIAQLEASLAAVKTQSDDLAPASETALLVFQGPEEDTISRTLLSSQTTPKFDAQA